MPPTRHVLANGSLPTTAFLILVALAEGEAHGYQIRQQVIEHSNGTVRLDPGSLYRLIARLFDEKLIEERPARPLRQRNEDADDDSRRRYYRLTARGRQVLLSETNRLAALVDLARDAAKRPRHA